MHSHSSGTPLSLASATAPLAISQLSRRPFWLQSPDSHSSGTPFASQSPDVEQAAQSWPAAMTQFSSHEISQQLGTAAQTASQHWAFWQNGPVEDCEQGWSLGSPQAGCWQSPPEASAAQLLSHAESQQEASTAQTAEQQVASSHEGVACAEKQLPAPASPHFGMQAAAACFTQAESHAASQHVMSIEHTSMQQLKSAQPGVFWATRHESELPPHGEQITSAASAQSESHWVLQQNSSELQSCWQQARSAQ